MATSDVNNGADKGRFLGETRIKRALRQPGPGVTAPHWGMGVRSCEGPFFTEFCTKNPSPGAPRRRGRRNGVSRSEVEISDPQIGSANCWTHKNKTNTIGGLAELT